MKVIVKAFSTAWSAQNISTIIHATTKLFVPFCSAQDGESTDMNCLVFWAYCKNGKILMKHQVYNKGFFTKFEYFSQYEILISLECAVDCEQIGIINYVVSCSIVGMKIHKNSGFSGLILHKTTLLEICLC